MLSNDLWKVADNYRYNISYHMDRVLAYQMSTENAERYMLHAMADQIGGAVVDRHVKEYLVTRKMPVKHDFDTDTITMSVYVLNEQDMQILLAEAFTKGYEHALRKSGRLD